MDLKLKLSLTMLFDAEGLPRLGVVLGAIHVFNIRIYTVYIFVQYTLDIGIEIQFVLNDWLDQNVPMMNVCWFCIHASLISQANHWEEGPAAAMLSWLPEGGWLEVLLAANWQLKIENSLLGWFLAVMTNLQVVEVQLYNVCIYGIAIGR